MTTCTFVEDLLIGAAVGVTAAGEITNVGLDPEGSNADPLWTAGDHQNAIWQLAYHTLFVTHLYLQPDQAAFCPWEGHQSDVQHPDAIPGRTDPDSELPPLPEPYTREQVLTHWRFCDAMVNDALDALDLFAPESGFHWYRMPKLDHQLVNVRHIQHHAAQLADRLRTGADIGIGWVGAGEAS